MDPDGRNRTRLTDPSSPGVDASGDTSPAWSPDGREIAFASSGDAVGEDQRKVEIYVMNADGGEKRRLTQDDVYDATPAWSPDGRRLAFAHTSGPGTEDAGRRDRRDERGRDGPKRGRALSGNARDHPGLAPGLVTGRTPDRLYAHDVHVGWWAAALGDLHRRPDRRPRAPPARRRLRPRLVARRQQDRLHEHPGPVRRDVLRGVQHERRDLRRRGERHGSPAADREPSRRSLTDLVARRQPRRVHLRPLEPRRARERDLRDRARRRRAPAPDHERLLGARARLGRSGRPGH